MKEHKDGGAPAEAPSDYYLACERQNVALLEAIGYPHEKDTLTSPEEYAAELKLKADAYDALAGMPPPPALFPREKFSGYTDNQVKYIRIGWNAAMRSDGVDASRGGEQ